MHLPATTLSEIQLQLMQLYPDTDLEKRLREALLQVTRDLEKVDVLLTTAVDEGQFLSSEYRDLSDDLLTAGAALLGKLSARTRA